MPDFGWGNSDEYSWALSRWRQRVYPTKWDYMVAPTEPFEQSQEFRDARLAFKKRINGRTSED